MKKIIINVLCFFILFNSFIAILSRSVYAIENYEKKTEKSDSNNKNEKKQIISFKNINEKMNLFTYALIGIGTIAFTGYIGKMCCQTNRGAPKLPKNNDIVIESSKEKVPTEIVSDDSITEEEAEAD